jgi:PmbA protein
MGEKIFPEFINLCEKPFIPKALGSEPFDGDGLPCTEKYFVREGILENYILSVYSARKLNLKPNGNANGVHNLQITTSNQDLKALLKTMNKGFLVTELMGQGVNIVTGDYSPGATGFWVENGEIQFPVSGVTIAGNLATLFKNIVCVGNDIDKRHNILTGSILLREMMIAGE